jgi:hypothetical protein
LEARLDACCSVIPWKKGSWASRLTAAVRAMIRFLSVSFGFAAPALAMLLVAGLGWNDGRKERRRTLALRQWLREQ